MHFINKLNNFSSLYKFNKLNYFSQFSKLTFVHKIRVKLILAKIFVSIKLSVINLKK